MTGPSDGPVPTPRDAAATSDEPADVPVIEGASTADPVSAAAADAEVTAAAAAEAPADRGVAEADGSPAETGGSRSSSRSAAIARGAAVARSTGASALWRDVVRAARADPGFAWALFVGLLLLGLGLLGFVPNPLVGAPTAAWGTPLLQTGDAHDVVHLVGGAIALHAALGMSRARRDVVLLGLGTAAIVLLALGLLDGRWFGIAPWPVGVTDQLLHLIVGLGSLLVGLAGTGTIVVPVVTGAYRRGELTSGAGSAAVTVPVEPAAEPVSFDPSEPLEPAAAGAPVSVLEPTAELDAAEASAAEASASVLEPTAAEPAAGPASESAAEAAEPVAPPSGEPAPPVDIVADHTLPDDAPTTATASGSLARSRGRPSVGAPPGVVGAEDAIGALSPAPEVEPREQSPQH